MSLADEDAGVVDALGQAEFEDLRLQPALQEVFHLQTQDVIQLHLPFIQHTNAHETPQQGVTYTQNCNNVRNIPTYNTLERIGTQPVKNPHYA